MGCHWTLQTYIFSGRWSCNELIHLVGTQWQEFHSAGSSKMCLLLFSLQFTWRMCKFVCMIIFHTKIWIHFGWCLLYFFGRVLQKQCLDHKWNLQVNFFVAGKPKLIKKTSEKHKPAMIAYSKKFRERMDAFIPNPAMEKRRSCPPNLKLWRGNVAPIHGLSKVVRHSLLLSQSLGNLLKYQ